MSRNVESFDSINRIIGAGVYVIYYKGMFPPYQPVSFENEIQWTRPIYVGKAIRKGGRKGTFSHDVSVSKALGLRLRKHAESISGTENLSLREFCFRYIVLDDIWIPLGENILIERFKPLWNVAVDGFGINDPGSGRLNQKRSPWDILHPGRSYAAKLKGAAWDLDAILGRIDDHFSGRKLRALPKALEEAAEEAAEADRGEI